MPPGNPRGPLREALDVDAEPEVHHRRIADRQRTAGLGSSCSPVIGVVLCFFFGLYTLCYQSELNTINDHDAVKAGTPVALAF